MSWTRGGPGITNRGEDIPLLRLRGLPEGTKGNHIAALGRHRGPDKTGLATAVTGCALAAVAACVTRHRGGVACTPHGPLRPPRTTAGHRARATTKALEANALTQGTCWKGKGPSAGGARSTSRGRGWAKRFRAGAGGDKCHWRGALGQGLMQEPALWPGRPALPDHEAEQPECRAPRPSGPSTTSGPDWRTGEQEAPASCM